MTAAERARVVVSNDARSIVYGPVSRALSTHIVTCGPCRSGDGFDLCLTAGRLLDELLSASMPREDSWY